MYFADVCAGPGGFSEYVLWKKKWLAKGFGFTLKGTHLAIILIIVGALCAVLICTVPHCDVAYTCMPL